MNKKDFIAELAKKTGLSTDDSAKVNDVLENNNLLAGLGNAGKIISDIELKNIGGIPRFEHATDTQVIEQIARMAVLDKIIP